MTEGRRIAVAAVGGFLVVLGLGCAFVGWIDQPDNSGDGIWDWGNARLSHRLLAIAVVLICTGVAAVAGAVYSHVQAKPSDPQENTESQYPTATR